MSELGFNKIAGAVLATGLAVLGLRELSHIIYAPEPAEKPGYAIAVVEETAGGAAEAEVIPDWGTVLPTADLKAGEGQAQKCISCHTFTKGGANGTGPNQWGVVGRKPGSHAGFAYSAAMTDLGSKVPAWDYDHLNEFLKSPSAYLPGTKMTFVGVKKVEDRVNLIAWLRTQADSPAAIPAPKPAAAATPASDAAAAGQPVAGAAAPAVDAANSTGPAAQKQNPGNAPG